MCRSVRVRWPAGLMWRPPAPASSAAQEEFSCRRCNAGDWSEWHRASKRYPRHRPKMTLAACSFCDAATLFLQTAVFELLPAAARARIVPPDRRPFSTDRLRARRPAVEVVGKPAATQPAIARVFLSPYAHAKRYERTRVNVHAVRAGGIPLLAYKRIPIECVAAHQFGREPRGHGHVHSERHSLIV